MKKKGILIFVVLLLSITAIFFAKEMQKSLVSKDIASKTEAKALQSDLKKDTSDENSKNNDNGKLQTTDNTDKSSEVKKEETKNTSKIDHQMSSSKPAETSKQNTEKVAASPNSNTSTSTSTSNTATANTNTTQNVSNSAAQNTNSNLPPNFIVRDTVSNKVIVSKHIDFNGATVADITKANVDCKVKTGDYFYEIAGIKERSAGQLSGWCYYINGSKPSIGAGSYTLKKDDVIEWKFLKDGVNN